MARKIILFNRLRLTLLLLLFGFIANGQSPTHIDQGASDQSISIFEEPRYLFLMVALVVILVVVYVALKRRGRD